MSDWKGGASTWAYVAGQKVDVPTDRAWEYVEELIKARVWGMHRWVNGNVTKVIEPFMGFGADMSGLELELRRYLKCESTDPTKRPQWMVAKAFVNYAQMRKGDRILLSVGRTNYAVGFVRSDKLLWLPERYPRFPYMREVDWAVYERSGWPSPVPFPEATSGP